MKTTITMQAILRTLFKEGLFKAATVVKGSQPYILLAGHKAIICHSKQGGWCITSQYTGDSTPINSKKDLLEALERIQAHRAHQLRKAMWKQIQEAFGPCKQPALN